MLYRGLYLGVLFVAAAALTGCSKKPPDIVEVEGVVTINNKPVPMAEVQLIPKIQGFGAEYIATGITDKDGRFKLTCKGQRGACACENWVVIAEGPLPDDARGMSGESQMKASRYLAGLSNRPIPPQYGTAGQTPLVITVTSDRKEYNFDLAR